MHAENKLTMKKMRFLGVLLGLLLCATAIHAATKPDMAQRKRYKEGPGLIFRLYLKDKNHSPYSLEHPTRFLSRRSLDRRNRQHLPLDSTDLPVSPHYLRDIASDEVVVIGQSRWQNTVLVKVKDSTVIHQLDQLPCVKGHKLGGRDRATGEIPRPIRRSRQAARRALRAQLRPDTRHSGASSARHRHARRGNDDCCYRRWFPQCRPHSCLPAR